jgi:hypothetical protein
MWAMHQAPTRPWDEGGLTFRTGKHVVANLFCVGCDALLGWMYISAPNGHEKYKEGKLPLHPQPG